MRPRAPTRIHTLRIRIPTRTKFSTSPGLRLRNKSKDDVSDSVCVVDRVLKHVLHIDYDLVRIYHPDSPIARKYPADVAQARFQAISKAYDLLRGKSAMTGDVLTDRERPVDPARFRPRAAPRRPHFNDTAGDERWKERVLLGATMLVRLFPWRVCATIVLWTRPTTRTQALVAFVVQTNVARQKAFVEVTHGARTGSSGPKHSLAEEALAEPTDAGRSR